MSDLRLMSCAGKREAEARRQDQKEFVAAKKRYAQMEALRVEMQRLGYEGVATARYKQLQTELKRLEREGSPPSSRTQRRARRGRSRRRSASAVAEGDERRASCARRSVSAERQSPRHDDEHLVRQMHGHKVQRTATGLTATTPDMQNGWWRSSPPRQRPAPRRSRSVSPGHSHPNAAYATRRSPARRRSASGSRAIPAGRTFGTAARRTGWRAPGSLEQSMTDEARVAARRRRSSSWSARCVANGPLAFGKGGGLKSVRAQEPAAAGGAYAHGSEPQPTPRRARRAWRLGAQPNAQATPQSACATPN